MLIRLVIATVCLGTVTFLASSAHAVAPLPELYGEAFCWHDAYPEGATQQQKNTHDGEFDEVCASYMRTYDAFQGIRKGDFFVLYNTDIANMLENGDSPDTLPVGLPPVFCCHVGKTDVTGAQRHRNRGTTEMWTETYRTMDFGLDLDNGTPLCASIPQPENVDWAFLLTSQPLTQVNAWEAAVGSAWKLRSYTDRSIHPTNASNPWALENQYLKVSPDASYSEWSGWPCPNAYSYPCNTVGKIANWNLSFESRPFAVIYPNKAMIHSTAGQTNPYWTSFYLLTDRRFHFAAGWRFVDLDADDGVTGFDLTVSPGHTYYLKSDQWDYPHYDPVDPDLRNDRLGVCSWKDANADTYPMRIRTNARCLRVGFTPMIIE